MGLLKSSANEEEPDFEMIKEITNMFLLQFLNSMSTISLVLL